MDARTRMQSLALILLRSFIGWHFLYEGYYKLMLPGWSPTGAPLAKWSAAGYLKGASGPFAGFFHQLASSALIGWIDIAIPIALLLIGVSLLLGLFTQLGCWGALGLLTLFYVAAIPLEGVPHPGTEGTYLLVSKTLIEWAAVFVVLVFRTGRIAGLDLLWIRRRAETANSSLPRRAASGPVGAEPVAPAATRDVQL
jgi:thiosulfate dehydrogenase (quinone) large subunit